jgi:Na+-translocating ferredoxin:NAD+ oxidoreductase RnfD subunit
MTPTGSITPTATDTPTPTATTPPSVCPPSVVFARFSNVGIGESVEGLGKVAPFLDIKAKRLAVRVAQATGPAVYFAPNGSGLPNSALVADGGFSDVETKNLLEAHQYTFTFAPGVSVTNFSLHMLDYSDWNPTLSTAHLVSMTAYDANGNVVSREELSHTTLAESLPHSSNLYGDLWINGDAASAPLGQPGNWLWNVSGAGIVRVVLDFSQGHDPNVAFDLLSFTTECASCQSFYTTDLSTIAVGQSVEGLGTVAPLLDIKAKRQAVRVAQATPPMVYLAPNGSGRVNTALVADGGFSDLQTKALLEPHEYNFTFAPGVTITNLSLHMLDFGDLNQPLDTSHFASMTAYDVNGNPVSKEVLSYTTPAINLPRSSSLYGDLWFTGDAATAAPSQPGNWIWNVSGNGIVRVVLEFGAGYDPNIAFDLLTFNVVCR